MDPCNSGLPDELLLRFFDDIGIDELCRLSRVSRKWRAITLSHPTFWTKAAIREWQLARGGLQCFLARMARCPDAGIVAEFDFHEHVPPPVLASVAANLHRITSLRMGCNLHVWPLEFLDAPAGRLERLEMQSWQAHHNPFQDVFTLQHRSIFAGYAPRLHTVKLTNTLFLLSLAPHVSFPSVRAVDISYSAPPDVVAADIFDRVAALFPAVRTLKVELFNYTPGGPAERFAATPLSDAASRTMAGLQELRLCFSLACKATLRHLPVGAIPKVELTNHVFNETDIVPALIPDGEFCVSYEGTAHSSNCRVSVWNFDPGDGLALAQRRVLDASDGHSLRSCTRTMRAYLISSRLFALSLDIRAWGTLLECIDVLPSLAVLRLVICAMDTSAWLNGTSGSLGGVVRCPSLRTWIMDAYADYGALKTTCTMSRSTARRILNSVHFDQRQSTLILRWVTLQEAGEAEREEVDDPCNVAFAREVVDNSTDASWFEQLAAQAFDARRS